jgi:hypothetical protein
VTMSQPAWKRADAVLSLVLAASVGAIWWYFS